MALELKIRELETTRLLLRPLELADAEQTQRIFPHWEIVKFLASVVPWPFPADGAFKHYRDRAIPAMERGDEWNWSICLKSDPGRLIGAIDLRRTHNSNRGFWLGLAWHGQGLMTEAAHAATAFWFDELGFPEMRVSKAIGNTASRRISQSNGMKLVAFEERDYVCGRLPTEVWAITADEWRSHCARSDGNSGRPTSRL